MRILLDTNILIHREAATVVRDDIGTLFRWLDTLGHSKCVHPASVAELQKHSDPSVRATFARKLAAYRQLLTVAASRADVEAVARQVDTTANDAVDTKLLNELAAGTVDLLISEDRKLRRKAGLLGLADQVFTIDAFLEKVTAENPTLVDYEVLSVRRELCGNIDVQEGFFDSFRADYPGFDRWFARKADETAYVCYDEARLVAFLYLKVEDAREPYPDITPQMPARRRLKIGTFKVEANGFRLGERFLKIVFDNAMRQGVDEVYVTIFQRSLGQRRLTQLFEEFGFRKHGEKNSAAGIEEVYARSMAPHFDVVDPKRCFPFISRGRPWYIVPIHGEYHTSLLPDSILNTESPADFVEQQPHRNAIRKAYVSRSIFRSLGVGDVIAFYRTGGYHKSVVTSLGVVDAVHTDFRGEEDFIARCRRRSVFTDAELREQWNYRPTSRPFVVEFLYAYALPKRPNMAALIGAGVIRDVGSAPRGFERLPVQSIASILQLSGTDPRLVVD